VKGARLRILLTADAVGGVWQYATDLGHALRPLGVEAVIALMGPPASPDQRALADGLTVIETGLPLDWLCDGPEPVLAAGEEIARLAAREAVDLVQLNMPTLAAGAAMPVPTIAVTHGCVSTWWEAARETPLDPAYHWHRAMTAKGLAHATQVVAPTASYGSIIARHYGLATAPEVVRNGRRPLRLPPAAHGDYAFTAGRLWDHVKNMDVLDAAAARLPIPFLAAGAARGPHGETIALRHLRLLGQLDENGIAARLAPRPVFVSAARFEPFGLAVLEAAAAGCPLVLSDIPTFRELWDEAALFVPVDDAEGYAEAVLSVLGDRTRRRRLGEAAQERAARYTPNAMAAGMTRLYRALAPVGRAAA
jgi:glycosyltransferase involved in cell wall biosynthesis